LAIINSWYVLAAASISILIALSWLWIKNPPSRWIIWLFVAASPMVFITLLMADADPDISPASLLRIAQLRSCFSNEHDDEICSLLTLSHAHRDACPFVHITAARDFSRRRGFSIQHFLACLLRLAHGWIGFSHSRGGRRIASIRLHGFLSPHQPGSWTQPERTIFPPK
jgi:hypothetical protein